MLLQALLGRTCSTGRQQLWVRETAHLQVVYSLLLFTSPQITHSSHQRLLSCPARRNSLYLLLLVSCMMQLVSMFICIFNCIYQQTTCSIFIACKTLVVLHIFRTWLGDANIFLSMFFCCMHVFFANPYIQSYEVWFGHLMLLI